MSAERENYFKRRRYVALGYLMLSLLMSTSYNNPCKAFFKKARRWVQLFHASGISQGRLSNAKRFISSFDSRKCNEVCLNSLRIL